MIDAVSSPLDVAELDRRLRAADPAAVLIPPRLLRRVIKRHRRLTGFGLQVPHRKCYVISRDALFSLVTTDELGIPSDRELPSTVLLMPRPDPKRLPTAQPGEILIKYWRLLFHAAVHRAIESRALTAFDVRARIRQVGSVAFDEVRTVLRQERFLLPPHDDASAYEEFAALYLELAYFAAPLLPHYFPAIEDFRKVEQLLLADVDGQALLAATRPPGAPEPTLVIDSPYRSCDLATDTTTTDGPREIEPAKSRVCTALAERAGTAGNSVRAALRYTQAARAATAKQVAAARACADAEIQKLVKRLRPALGLGASEAASWRQALRPLLPPAACGLWPAEARLLYDLQKVCIDFERPVSAPAPAEWFYSRFTKPFVQPLPDQPVVLAVKYLRRAASRLPNVRIGEADRQNLDTLLRAALNRAEAKLRDLFRPRIADALAAVGLTPANYPERIARDKLVEELLDLVATNGFLSLGDLRDALSRNQLKLPDLAGPKEFFTGDPLLRANREMAERMPGVYRRGEFYLRWLQRLSAAAFGTVSGRWLTLNLFAPFGGAFLAIEGPFQIAHELSKLSRFLLRLVGLMQPLSPDHVSHHAPFPLAPIWAIVAGGLFFWLLLHVAVVRRKAGQVVTLIGRGLRAVLLEVPAAIFRWPALRQILDSPATWFLIRYGLKPLLPAIVVAVLIADWGFGPRRAAINGGMAFLASILFLSTRFSREFEEVTADWAVRRWEYIRDFLPGLFRLIMDFFKRVMEAIDRGLYAVDEWLRFRGAETQFTRAWKTIAGLAWGGVSYVIRFIVVLFIEPQINPIKHFPVVTIAHKLLLPMIPSLAAVFIERYGLEKEAAGLIATIIIGKIPGVFGFFVWELKTNWRLYQANRPPNLQPAMIGHHGETLPRLLRPGFHSGTLPKLYAKLRRAERRATKTGDWRAARRHLEALDHAERAIGRFAQRELLAYINGSPEWANTPLHLARWEAGSNQVRLDLACPAAWTGRLELRFEEQCGWLLAAAPAPDWSAATTAEQRAVLDLALIGFFKASGADLLQADVEAIFGAAPFDVTDDGLAFWVDDETEVVYDLYAEPTVTPRVVVGKPPEVLPTPTADALEFRRRPVTWEQWVAAWEQPVDEKHG
jgi:hypothetical protein